MTKTVQKAKREFCKSYIMKKALACADTIPWDWKAWSRGPCCNPKLAVEYPDKDWDWDALTNLADADTILQHPNLPWSWATCANKFSVSEILTLCIKYKKENGEWDLYALKSFCFMNPRLGIKDVVEHLHDLPWDWECLSASGSITLEEKLAHQELPWDWWKASRSIEIHPDMRKFCLGEDLPASLAHLSFLQDPNIECFFDHPDKNWNWFRIQRNAKNLTVDILRKHRDWKWDWNLVTQNRAISLADIYENSDLPWEWDCVHEKQGFQFSDLLRFPDKEWSWFSISSDEYQPTFEVVASFLDKKWRWYSLSQYMRVTIEDVKARPELPWDFKALSSNRHIPFADMRATPDLPWDVKGMSENPSLTMSNVRECPDWDWDWYELSSVLAFTIDDLVTLQAKKAALSFHALSLRVCEKLFKEKNPILVTLADVLSHPTLPWEWDTISEYAPLTIQTILEHPDIPWVWKNLSRNTHISLDDMLAHDELEWDWKVIFESSFSFSTSCKVESVPLNVVKQHRNLPWDWYYLSKCISDLSVQDVVELNDWPWSWQGLAQNPFQKDADAASLVWDERMPTSSG